MHFEESSLTLRVRPNDLDTLGHVNNATTLEYLEAGRWAWLERQGLTRG
ncbi:acyl-CoA thioesterase, partial [Corallococcus sp. AB049A]